MPTRQEGRSAGHGTAGSGQGGNASARRDRPCVPRGSIGRVLGGGSKEKQDTAEVRLRSRERNKKEEKVLRTAREKDNLGVAYPFGLDDDKNVEQDLAILLGVCVTHGGEGAASRMTADTVPGAQFGPSHREREQQGDDNAEELLETSPRLTWRMRCGSRAM